MPKHPSNTNRAVIQRNAEKSPLKQGQYYALIIGISNYKHYDSLEFPTKDARKIERILTNNYTFPKANITFLEDATRSNILDTLDGFEQILEPEDSLLIFYAGHGHWDKRRNRGFWLPKDAKIKAKSAWISNTTLQDYLMAYPCQHVLVISDSCFSGALLMNRRAMIDATKDFQVLYSAKSRKAITSGVKEEVPDRSVFFKELSNFLKRNTHPYLSASELFAGIRNKIIATSPLSQKPQFGAIDDTGDEGGDFIFIKKGTTETLTLEKPSPYDFLLQDPRTKERLLALRKQLDRDIPVKTLGNNLLVATWNIRKLGGNDYGGRTPEALAYIATIIERFDIVAIQEIYGDFKVLDDIKAYLGEHWDYFFSDTSIGLGGSDYRLGFFFDKRKVQQGGMISDLMLPSTRTRDENGRFIWKPAVQLMRPPFNMGFKIADKRVILCNMHLVFGSRQRKEERLEELDSILNFWKWRTHIKNVWSKNVILLGNFQTENLNEKEIHMVKESVFELSDTLKVPSNAVKTRYYNQIAFHLNPSDIQLTKNGGAFDFFESVFRKMDSKAYEAQMEKLEFTDKDGKTRTFRSKRYFYDKFWRTSQMSDNLPVWTELTV